MFIHADSVGRVIAKFRWLQHGSADRRAAAHDSLLKVFEFLESRGFGHIIASAGSTPVFQKRNFHELGTDVQKALIQAEMLAVSFPQPCEQAASDKGPESTAGQSAHSIQEHRATIVSEGEMSAMQAAVTTG